MKKCPACEQSEDRFTTLLDNCVFEYTTADGAQKEFTYKLLKCSNCGVGFVDPFPDEETISHLYTESYYSPLSDASIEKGSRSLKYRIAKWRYPGIVNRTAGFIHSFFNSAGCIIESAVGKKTPYTMSLPLKYDEKKARLLDVGYGRGRWLLIMEKLGYTGLHGYDIATNTEIGKRLEGIGVVTLGGTFLDLDYTDYFDCIRLEHVLEHIENPIDYLRKCKSMLKPSGVFVMSVPSFRSWYVDISLKRYPSLDIPRHVLQHTPQSLRSVFKAAGFSEFSVEQYNIITTLVNFITNLPIIVRFPIIRKMMRILYVFSPLYYLLGKITGRGDQIIAWAKK